MRSTPLSRCRRRSRTDPPVCASGARRAKQAEAHRGDAAALISESKPQLFIVFFIVFKYTKTRGRRQLLVPLRTVLLRVPFRGPAYPQDSPFLLLPEQNVRAAIPGNFQGIAEPIPPSPPLVHVDPKRFSWLQCDEQLIRVFFPAPSRSMFFQQIR